MGKVLLEGVGRSFGEARAVDDVSLQVEQGEFVTLLGPSGCGKTTTLRMIAGLEQNTRGRISINGEVVSDPATGKFVPPERRQLGMVFQSYAIWPHMTVFDNVAYPLKIRGRTRNEINEAVVRALDTVEMGHLAQRPATALSGGQQQRVAIARAIVFEPQVLLLDEPLSNLDAKLRTQMGDEFRALQRRLRITTLYVTHDQEEAMALSDRVVLMHTGRVLQMANPSEIYERPVSSIVAKFFGEPNLLPGLVASSVEGDGAAILRMEGNGWSGECLAATAARAGTPLTAMVRPENFLLTRERPEARADSIVLNGEVRELTYHGARRRVVVNCEGLPVRVDIGGRRPISLGDQVWLQSVESAAWALDVASQGAKG